MLFRSNDTATTEIYTLSLHDALPIFGAEFVSNRFADYYFSITPTDAALSGLPVFDADGGMKNWKASLLLNQSISGNLLHGFSVFGTTSYSRLVGDFKRSPIVSERGSPNQWLAAAGLAYTW